MKISDMNPIETTFEATEGDYIYRVTIGDDYAMIKRTLANENRPVWSHSVLTQGYDAKTQSFQPMIKIDRLISPEMAESVLAEIGPSTPANKL